MTDRGRGTAQLHLLSPEQDPSTSSESVWRLLKMSADSPLRNPKNQREQYMVSGRRNIHLRARRWRKAFDRLHAVAVYYGYHGEEDFYEANGFYW